MASLPFRPHSSFCSLTRVSLFLTLNLTAFPTSSSLDITLLAGLAVANLISTFSSLFFSSKSGDKSNPSDSDIRWNAFIVAGCFAFSEFSNSISGSVSIFFLKLFGTGFLNHEESMTLEIVILVLGFGSRSFVMSRRASEENHGGHLKSPLTKDLPWRRRSLSFRGPPARRTPEFRKWCAASRLALDTAAVAEIDGGDQLLEVESSHVFSQSASGDFVEKLAASNELHGDVNLGFTSHHLVKLHDVRMLHHKRRRVVHPSSTCFRWQFRPLTGRLAATPTSDLVSTGPLIISLHSLSERGGIQKDEMVDFRGFGGFRILLSVFFFFFLLIPTLLPLCVCVFFVRECIHHTELPVLYSYVCVELLIWPWNAVASDRKDRTVERLAGRGWTRGGIVQEIGKFKWNG
ncbi:hypothetical protein G2W53_038681 [Senna tora]|uniref:Uncharacterized protein n=1 Tax=Senna tora TaxID=362788 RepID=A0A834SPF8_9FABA|nr:hypothetical protein G2W53_038681 [Senna tora]